MRECCICQMCRQRPISINCNRSHRPPIIISGHRQPQTNGPASQTLLRCTALHCTTLSTRSWIISFCAVHITIYKGSRREHKLVHQAGKDLSPSANAHLISQILLILIWCVAFYQLRQELLLAPTGALIVIVCYCISSSSTAAEAMF